MAIKLNGVTITSNKLNGSDVSEEKLNGTIVYSAVPTMTQWQFVGSSSSEPYNYDLMTSVQHLGSDYEEGIDYLNINYPAGNYNEGFVAIIPDAVSHDYFEYVVVAMLEFEFYEIPQYDYNSKEYRLDVTVSEGSSEVDVMYAFKTQHTQTYETVGSVNYHMFGVRANDGHGYTYWAIRPK